MKFLNKIEKIETYYHCSKIQEVRYMSKNEMNQNYSDNKKQENKTKTKGGVPYEPPQSSVA